MDSVDKEITEASLESGQKSYKCIWDFVNEMRERYWINQKIVAKILDMSESAISKWNNEFFKEKVWDPGRIKILYWKYVKDNEVSADRFISMVTEYSTVGLKKELEDDGFFPRRVNELRTELKKLYGALKTGRVKREKSYIQTEEERSAALLNFEEDFPSIVQEYERDMLRNVEDTESKIDSDKESCRESIDKLEDAEQLASRREESILPEESLSENVLQSNQMDENKNGSSLLKLEPNEEAEDTECMISVEEDAFVDEATIIDFKDSDGINGISEEEKLVNGESKKQVLAKEYYEAAKLKDAMALRKLSDLYLTKCNKEGNTEEDYYKSLWLIELSNCDEHLPVDIRPDTLSKKQRRRYTKFKEAFYTKNAQGSYMTEEEKDFFELVRIWETE